MIETVLRIGPQNTRSFFAGVVLQNDVVVETHPPMLMRLMHDWSGDRVSEYCVARGWNVEVVQEANHVKEAKPSNRR